MNQESSPLEAAYYKELDRFVELCADLTATGKPILTVLLCHELYRVPVPVRTVCGLHP